MIIHGNFKIIGCISLHSLRAITAVSLHLSFVFEEIYAFIERFEFIFC